MLLNPKSLLDATFRLPTQCICLKLNGSWPLSSNSRLRSYNYFGIFYTVWSWYVIISVGITIYFQSAFLFHSLGDIIMLTENCCTTFMGALNFVRLLHLRLNIRQFRAIIEQFVRDIWIVKGTLPRVERDCTNRMTTYRIMSLLLICLIGMYCFLPLVELFSIGLDAPEKPFPYKMRFPYDANHGWRYMATYIFTAYAGFCVVTNLLAEDTIFGFFVTYTCGQYQILHERIDNIVPLAYARVLAQEGVPNPQSLQLEFNRQLKDIARMHSTLIEFANRLENFFSPVLLVNYMISTILMCMVGFQLVTGKDMFIGDYVKFIVFILSTLSQLYVLCWNGDRLIQISLETANHLYGCNWEGNTISRPMQMDRTHKTDAWQLLRQHVASKYMKQRHGHPTSTCTFTGNTISHLPASKEFRTNLQFMILCSQRPVRITAFKFSTLSLQSFTRLLSTSLSYFTLLQTLYNGETDDSGGPVGTAT